MKQLVITLFLPLVFACTRSAQPVIKTDKGNCENAITIDDQRYNKTSGNTFNITKAEISGDCLEVTIAASGCDGKTWTAEMVSNGIVAESHPPQMYLKILFTNPDACLAVPSRKFSYNLKPLRQTELNKVTFHLQGWSTGLTYQY